MAEPATLLDRILAQRWRFLKFCAVGGSGVLVNLGLVWVGNEILFASLPEWWRTSLSYLVGILVSILTNFLLNDFWTWRDRRGAGGAAFAGRLARYYAVSALAASLQYMTSLGATALVAVLVHGSAGAVVAVWWKWLAVLAGVAVGTLVNFVMNHVWTYRGGATSSRSPGSG
jgi:dolichol-phosphate mannosyltransferase